MSVQKVYGGPPSFLPIMGLLALVLSGVGVYTLLNEQPYAWAFLGSGLFLMLVMLLQWFSLVIQEYKAGAVDDSVVAQSMKWGMSFFIYTEIILFAVLFVAFFYIRYKAFPLLEALEVAKGVGREVLLPMVRDSLPIPFVKEAAETLVQERVVDEVGIPLLNTLLLMVSGLAITLSELGLQDGKQKRAWGWLLMALVFAVGFLVLQSIEFSHVVFFDFTKKTNIYGTIVYIFTGFHAVHLLFVVLTLFSMSERLRSGVMTATANFVFDALVWFWHFLDVVWLLLFIFVYWT